MKCNFFKDRSLKKLWTDFDVIFRICAPLAEVCALRVLLFSLNYVSNLVFLWLCKSIYQICCRIYPWFFFFFFVEISEASSWNLESITISIIKTQWENETSFIQQKLHDIGNTNLLRNIQIGRVEIYSQKLNIYRKSDSEDYIAEWM